MPPNHARQGFGAVVSCALVITGVALAADDPPASRFESTPEIRAALDHISADSLKGHLSFVASDLLEGRDTPSRGLDLAAAYIAAQFRRAGLEPAGDDDYFQTARWRVSEPNPAGVELEIKIRDQTYRAPSQAVGVSTDGKLEVIGSGVYKLDQTDAKTLEELSAEQIEGKTVVAAIPDAGAVDRAQRNEAVANRIRILTRLAKLKAALVLTADPAPVDAPRPVRRRLIDPERPNNVGRRVFAAPGPPVVSVRDADLLKRLEELPSGPTPAVLTLRVADPVERPVALKNVAGLLRGSDPELKDTYVLVTAHYDHIGIGAAVNGDRIYNGANDDGSGTVSVVEIASALASLKERPKRSILFLTFFGEEKGLLGSRYYGAHPLAPVAKTIADVNLEQVGRTDSTEGPNIATASMTGFDYSEVGKIFEAAGEREGVKVAKHPLNSDMYFGASDNQALADLGVPAHTICVSFQYSDYHGAADHWEKVDFVNMAKVDRMVGLGLLMIANTPAEPRWNGENPKAARYLKAWKKLHGED
jgi:Peptidase family M28